MMRLSFVLATLSLLSTIPAMGKGWIFSGGLGLTISPELFLINPQLEYIHDARLSYGPQVQAAVGNGASLVTMTGSMRYLLGNHPKFKPAVEGGVGLALGSGRTSSVGVHLMAGMGVDYRFDNQISFGSMIRMNLAPPLTTFFLSWPLFMFRMAL